MNQGIRLVLTLWKGRSPLFRIALVVFVALLLIYAVEYFMLQHYQDNWERVVEEQSARYLKEVEREFVSFQRTTRKIGTEIAGNPAVLNYLSGTDANRVTVFDYVSGVSTEQDAGVELYDKQGTLIAWGGRSGPGAQREVSIALAGQLTSYVLRTTIYAQLFVAIPVRIEGKIIGAVVVRRAIETNYPISNNIITAHGLADELTRRLGAAVEFNFSELAEPRKDGRYASAYLYGIDSVRVGVVSVLRPVPSAFLEGVSTSFQRIRAVLFTALIVLGVIAVWPAVQRLRSALLRCLGVTALTWSARYALLWVDMPSRFVSEGIFDPVHFASTFGGGMAKSIGELGITALALLLNTVLVMNCVTSKARDSRRSPWWYPSSPVVRVVVAIATSTFMFLLLRGYGATIRSAVFDSTLKYNDPGVIVPSFELGIMVLNLFIISFCLIVVGVGMTSFLLHLAQGSGTRTASPWMITAGLLILTSILYGILHPNPLIPAWYRLLYAGGLLLFTYLLHMQAREDRPLATVGNALIALGISAVFFYPLLDAKIHERDRERIKGFAAEILRPVEGWLRLVVDEALEGFLKEETLDILLHGTPGEVEQLAFTTWARSAVSREGYSCYFAVTDEDGRVLSQFTIGGQSFLTNQREAPWRLSTTRNIQVHEIGSGINAVKVYAGSLPFIVDNGRIIGYALAVVSAGQQTLFRGETPRILRTTTQESVESFYRPVTVSEFRNGVLFTSNSDDFPIGYQLPEKVRDALRGDDSPPLWVEQEVNDKRFETFVVRASVDPDRIISLGLPELGLAWHLFSLVKVLMYYAIVALVLVVCTLSYRWARGERYRFTFRDRLLAAFVLTALVPIVSITWYARTFAQERLMETTARRLEQETATVALNTFQRLGNNGEFSEHNISPYFAEQLAMDLGTDFNFYVVRDLRASSRPELYESGILDRRLPGSAYAAVMVQGKRFHVQTEQLGSLRYAVGYRPLLTSDDRVLGIISVPTLYRQDELEEELSSQNAFIFAVYAFVLFAILIIATTVANRIAAPIHRLTQATKRVSQGDLNVNVGTERVDGEVGELVRSFRTMTQALQRSREELIRAERELAWKEMAKQVAHEIKNPLTPMKLQLQHLLQTYKDRVPEFGRILEEVSRTIIEQIDTLSRIAGEFSRYARMPKPQMDRCDLNAILTESAQLFEKQDSVHLELKLDPSSPQVLADREELRRAFINIIRNGIQAMDNAGRMAVATFTVAHNAVITFRDYGSGIAPEVKARLFEPNFSTKTEGMGLGLAIVKKTLDDLGGTITVDSTHGEGTLVTITLQLAPQPSS